MHIILGTMTFADPVDPSTSAELINRFHARGHEALDTAHVYNDGQTETLLGALRQQDRIPSLPMAGKVNPWHEGGLSPTSIDRQLHETLERLGVDSLDLLYLHAPDLDVPIEDTLACIARHHRDGRFQRFGLSNYAAWQVAEIVCLCRANGWPAPVVYQGMYNALTRDVERELFPCLERFGMAFYAYNPLAGGLLTGKYRVRDDLPSEGRFADNAMYQDRYWKPEYFEVINRIADTARELDIAPAAAALRWLRHHSALTAENEPSDKQPRHGIILGATSGTHLDENLDACEAGPLPASLVEQLDTGWLTVKPACKRYFRP